MQAQRRVGFAMAGWFRRFMRIREIKAYYSLSRIGPLGVQRGQARDAQKESPC
jgi:hypothetical protein